MTAMLRNLTHGPWYAVELVLDVAAGFAIVGALIGLGEWAVR